MVTKTKKIWMDGEFVNWDDANVHILTHTLHYGVGVFEGIRCYKTSNGKSSIFRLDDHIARLVDGTKILNIKCPFSKQEIINACVETVKINNLEECYIRPLIFVGDGKMGLHATTNPIRIAIAAWPWGAYLGDGALENGIRARVSSFNRHHVNVAMVQGKICGQYVTSILAKHEAMKAGYDEAIMLDTNGYVAEASAENIFAIKQSIVYTPPFSSPILSGITRETAITLLQERGVKVRTETFTRDFLYLCDELFFTGTAAEVTPVIEIDDRQVSNGKPGEITQQLQKDYFATIRGENDKHKEWLTYVG